MNNVLVFSHKCIRIAIKLSWRTNWKLTTKLIDNTKPYKTFYLRTDHKIEILFGIIVTSLVGGMFLTLAAIFVSVFVFCWDTRHWSLWNELSDVWIVQTVFMLKVRGLSNNPSQTVTRAATVRGCAKILIWRKEKNNSNNNKQEQTQTLTRLYERTFTW